MYRVRVDCHRLDVEVKKSKEECKEEPKEEPKEETKEEPKEVNEEKPQVVFLLGGPGSGMCEEAYFHPRKGNRVCNSEGEARLDSHQCRRLSP